MTEPDWTCCTEEEFWEFIAWHLKAEGIDTVLVGGAVVAIYTEGLYRSGDLDLVPDDFHREKIGPVLDRLGFEKQGRHYRHPRCRHLFVEFPVGPVSLGADSRITPAEREVDGQTIRLLSATDCVGSNRPGNTDSQNNAIPPFLLQLRRDFPNLSMQLRIRAPLSPLLHPAGNGLILDPAQLGESGSRHRALLEAIENSLPLGA